MRTNYVIATYGGYRSSTDLAPQYNRPAMDDRTWYLRSQLASLAAVKHSLDQITVVVSPAPDEPSYFTDYIESLQYPVLRRKVNTGMSYGGYGEAFDAWPDSFDYWFFVEDDYHFPLNDFDTIFKENMGPHSWLTAGGAECGVTTSEALRCIRTRYGYFPTAQNDYSSQLRWVANFADNDMTKGDLTATASFSAGYWWHHGQIWKYGTGPEILMPLQSLNMTVPRIQR